MLNQEHRAYQEDLWRSFSKIANEMFKEKIIYRPSYMDLPFIKRFIFRKMFFDDTMDITDITRNDHEYLDDYEGIRGLIARIYSSGLVKHINITFDEILQMNNCDVDWLFQWLEEQSKIEEKKTSDSLKDLENEFKNPPIDTKIKKNPIW